MRPPVKSNQGGVSERRSPVVARAIRERDGHAAHRADRDRRAHGGVQTGQQGSYVFVVKPDMTVDLRTIAVQRQIAETTVVENGLKPDEMVVPTASCASFRAPG